MAHYQDFGLLTADGAIKSVAGHLKSITFSWRGMTAGEFCTIINGTDITGDDKVMIVVATANGTLTKTWPGKGRWFGSGIFFNKGASDGSVWIEGQVT